MIKKIADYVVWVCGVVISVVTLMTLIYKWLVWLKIRWARPIISWGFVESLRIQNKFYDSYYLKVEGGQKESLVVLILTSKNLHHQNIFEIEVWPFDIKNEKIPSRVSVIIADESDEFRKVTFRVLPNKCYKILITHINIVPLCSIIKEDSFLRQQYKLFVEDVLWGKVQNSPINLYKRKRYLKRAFDRLKAFLFV